MSGRPLIRPGLLGRRERGQGAVEAALVLLTMLPAVVGLLGIGRMIEAQAGVNAVAYEVARAAALANTAAEAEALGQERKNDLAAPYRLTNGTLDVTIEAGDVVRGQPVVATVSYQVAFEDIPLLGWARREVSSRHTEHVERYRSILR